MAFVPQGGRWEWARVKSSLCAGCFLWGVFNALERAPGRPGSSTGGLCLGWGEKGRGEQLLGVAKATSLLWKQP